LAELVYLGLKELGIEEVDIFAPGDAPVERFLGLRVHDVGTMRQGEYDRIILVSLQDVAAGSVELQERDIAPNKIVTLFNGKAF
jgi:hypothetical protein